MRELAVKVEARLPRPGFLSRRRFAGESGGKKERPSIKGSRAVRKDMSGRLAAECIERLFHGFTDTGKDRRIA